MTSRERNLSLTLLWPCWYSFHQKWLILPTSIPEARSPRDKGSNGFPHWGFCWLGHSAKIWGYEEFILILIKVEFISHLSNYDFRFYFHSAQNFRVVYLATHKIIHKYTQTTLAHARYVPLIVRTKVDCTECLRKYPFAIKSHFWGGILNRRTLISSLILWYIIGLFNFRCSVESFWKLVPYLRFCISRSSYTCQFNLDIGFLVSL
jgi:hypothetical protein